MTLSQIKSISRMNYYAHLMRNLRALCHCAEPYLCNFSYQISETSYAGFKIIFPKTAFPEVLNKSQPKRC